MRKRDAQSEKPFSLCRVECTVIGTLIILVDFCTPPSVERFINLIFNGWELLCTCMTFLVMSVGCSWVVHGQNSPGGGTIVLRYVVSHTLRHTIN